jgi:hypothetical protein
VLVSFCYVLLRWLLELVEMPVGSNEFMELEIVVPAVAPAAVNAMLSAKNC